jgi:hypothetical protein
MTIFPAVIVPLKNFAIIRWQKILTETGFFFGGNYALEYNYC